MRTQSKSNAPGCKLTTLRGSMVAMATPFRDGAIDAATLSALCERQIKHGTAALIVAGSTGEGSALRAPEYAQVVAIAVEAAAGRVPVIAGCSTHATEEATTLALAAAQNGAAALLCAPPAYVKPTQEGIIAHIRAIAHAADRPIMLYDVPSRVGTAIADPTIALLFERGLIAAIKDATADLARPSRLRALCGETLVQLTGDDATAPAYRAMGGHGCVSVTANLVPLLCALQHASWDRGDLATFARTRDLLAPLHQALFLESNPIPLKAALGMLKLCAPDMRLPLTKAAAATRDRLAAVLAAIGKHEEALAGRPHLALVR